MHLKTIQKCRACKNVHLNTVLDLGKQNIQGIFNVGQKVLPTRKVPVQLVQCDTTKQEDSCGLVQLSHTVPGEILYSSYFYQSDISGGMKNHLKSIADNVIKLLDKKSNVEVLDIAANSLYFLSCFPPSMKRIGIDPSNIILEAKDRYPDIGYVNDFYPSPVLKNRKFDFISAVAVFYDIENPLNFLFSVKENLKEDGIFLMELSYLPLMLENLGYDSILNEHLCYYSLGSLECLFKAAGLKVFLYSLNNINGGSIQLWLTHDNNYIYDIPEHLKLLKELRIFEFNLGLDEKSTYLEFANRVKKHSADLFKLIESLVNEGKKIHLYGASTKLNVLLQFAGIDSRFIQYASERTEEKFGGYTLGGIKMISEQESRAMKPDYYLVGPWWNKEEFLKREEEFIKNGGKFIFPLPEISIT